ncbi:MAG: dihydroorotase [Nitrospirae bacterium]|nr:dihydroorotase [Nitrospirota bacterium]
MSGNHRSILIKGGRVVDPASGVDGLFDLLLKEGKVAELRPSGKTASSGKEYEILSAEGHVVVPGLVDIHVHFREPGFEYRETIATGVRSAVAGGVTSVCCMPNTNPVNDTASVTRFILAQSRREGLAHVYPIGAITKGSQGEEITEMGELKEAGCVAVSDDGRPVMQAGIMRRALEYARAFHLPVIDHCEDLTLTDDGVMHEGRVSTELGLKGIPSASEEVMVARDVALAEATGGRIHIAHVSTAGAVRVIREAKARGVAVTAETCPHYFLLTHEAVRGYNTNAKMNPPLREEADVLAVREGLRDGTIDAIATDHAPHHPDEKLREFDAAPFGIVGLETLLPLSLRLVEEGVLTLPEMVARLTHLPARVMGIPRGTLAPGAPADVTVFDPKATWRVDAGTFLSKGRNTPFQGWELKGRVVRTIVEGKVVL